MNIKAPSILTFVIFLYTTCSLAQNPTLYIGGTAHIGNGVRIENAAISVIDGKFDIVADASRIKLNPDAFDTIIRLYGKHIYPSFIVPNTTLGITEIDAVRASRDFKEVGNINPNVRSLVAYNTDSKISTTIRTNGVLLAQVTPRGGIISGQSSVFYLDGKNWEDAVCRADDGIHINWPSSFQTSGWWAEPGETKKNKKYNNKIQEIKILFERSRAYFESHKIMDLRMESMKGLFDGSKTLYIHANYAKDIRNAINMALEFGVKNCVLVGGEDAESVLDILIENNIPVILNRIHRLPDMQDAPIDKPFTQPKQLKEAGVLFCFSYEGDMEAMGARNIPFTAGTAVAYGLSYEDAISSLSLNTAKILGIAKNIGSIETGKEATFFISTGDALDMRTNNIEHAFIKGKAIDLNNHQKELFEKYKNK